LRTRLAAVIAAAFFIVPAAASASTVSLAPADPDAPPRLTYTAANGEANKLDVKVTNATAEISDSGAGTITPGANCTAVNAKKVTCTEPQGKVNFVVLADLGDGNDTFDLAGADSSVNGGAGNDNLNGGERQDFLSGGGGKDDLNGKAGADTLKDNDTSGAADKDTYDGGDGVDLADYGSRTAAVTVDLADNKANKGEAGEGDDLARIENVAGGSGNDTLSGDANVNFLSGVAGNDTVNGRAGNDQIGGFTGNDTLIGEAGRDDIEGGDGDDTLRLLNPAGEYDRLLTCGDGKDTIVGLAAAPSVEMGCELGDFGFSFVTGLKPKKVGTTEVTVKIPCPEIYRKGGVCKGSIVVEPKSAYLKSPAERAKNRFGVAKFAIDGAGGKVKVKMNSKGQKELKKSAFKLQFHINLKETASGTKRQFEWTSYLVRQFL
jgi:Ca2+-binding RTX toxin-like protein